MTDFCSWHCILCYRAEVEAGNGSSGERTFNGIWSKADAACHQPRTGLHGKHLFTPIVKPLEERWTEVKKKKIC